MRVCPGFQNQRLRLPVTGRAKEYFDIWEADRDTTIAQKSYEEFLTKVKDYSRRRKLDSAAQKNIQRGGDPMDIGQVGSQRWSGGYKEERGT